MNSPSHLRLQLAWALALFSLVLVIASAILLVLDWAAIDSPGTAQVTVIFGSLINGALGLLITIRRPRNFIGWFLLAIAAVGAVFLFTNFLAIRALLSGAVPNGWVAWPGNVLNTAFPLYEYLIFFLILFFPNGKLLPGPRWRWVAGVALAAIGVEMVQALTTVALNQLSPRLPRVPNPLAVQAFSALTNSNSLLPQLSFFLLIVLVLVAVIVRFRRSQALERQQMRGFAYVAGATLAAILLTFTFTPPNHQLTEASFFVFIATFLTLGVARYRRWRNPKPSPLRKLPYAIAVLVGFGALIYSFTSPNNGPDLANAAFGLGFGILLPATIGLAVIRHGLYDLDIFVSRTIVYASLAVFITAVYVGIAVGIGTLVGSGGKPNLALSILATAIVALGFQPVRERVQKLANRLVYGQRATPYEVLSQFSERVAESYAADEVLPRMANVLAAGTGAEVAEVWLRQGDHFQCAAVYPLETPPPDALPWEEGSLPEFLHQGRSVLINHQGSVLGALAISKRRGESLTPIEIKLMDDLAHQAGLVLKNVGLTADLQARLVELRASRQRLVSAQDDERRKLERNLHDGAQQYLVAIKVKLGLALMILAKDKAKALKTIQQLKADADEALEALRDLARGVYPPLLADQGLVAALQSHARKATLPVSIVSATLPRFSPDLEATVYFCVLEALQNIQKYAHAQQATIELTASASGLAFTVQDDGQGFDPASTPPGSGLTNLEDRLDALGGSFQITSHPGQGTTLFGTLPLLAPV